MLHILDYYLPAVLLIAVTALFIDWRVAVSASRPFHLGRRLPLSLLIGVVIAIMMRYA